MSAAPRLQLQRLNSLLATDEQLELTRRRSRATAIVLALPELAPGSKSQKCRPLPFVGAGRLEEQHLIRRRGEDQQLRLTVTIDIARSASAGTSSRASSVRFQSGVPGNSFGRSASAAEGVCRSAAREPAIDIQPRHARIDDDQLLQAIAGQVSGEESIGRSFLLHDPHPLPAGQFLGGEGRSHRLASNRIATPTTIARCDGAEPMTNRSRSRKFIMFCRARRLPSRASQDRCLNDTCTQARLASPDYNGAPGRREGIRHRGPRPLAGEPSEPSRVAESFNSRLPPVATGSAGAVPTRHEIPTGTPAGRKTSTGGARWTCLGA